MRKQIHAGGFYPRDKEELTSMITSLLKKSKTTNLGGELKAIIVPHAGYIYSGIVAAAGYNLIKKPFKKIILIGPSHYYSFYGAAVSREDWQTPLGVVKTFQIKEGILQDIPKAHFQEHSLEVQLPWLQMILKNFTILPIVANKINEEELAKTLIQHLNENTLIVVSSDLSHFYDYETAKELDAKANKHIPELNIDAMDAVEACGKTAILVLMHLAKLKNWKAKLIDYKNSGDTAGDKSRVVGYGCYAFYT